MDEDVTPLHEDLTVTLPADLADAVKRAVATGDYRSPSELVGLALRDWSARRSGEPLEALRADIDIGLADIAAAQVGDVDMDRIVTRGRQLLQRRSRSD